MLCGSVAGMSEMRFTSSSVKYSRLGCLACGRSSAFIFVEGFMKV